MRRTLPVRRTILSALLLGIAAQAHAGVGPDGFEFIVNTYTTDDQTLLSVASRGADGYVLLWRGFSQLSGNANDDIFARRFDPGMTPVGAEFLVNSFTDGNQSEGRVVSDGSGGFLVVWSSFMGDGSGEGVLARRYDSLGLPIEGEFVVNGYTAGSQYRPNVSMNASGAFVVAWADASGQDGDGFGVFARIFDSTGAAVGSDFQVNTWTTGTQSFPAVSMQPGGDFLVAWTDFSGADGSGWGSFAQLFDSSGQIVGGELMVAESTVGDQTFDGIQALPGGDFVVVWSDQGGADGSGYGVFGRIFDSTGSPAGGEFQVNTRTLGNQMFSAAASDPDGRFVVVWTDAIGGANYDVLGQRFDGGGARLGLEFRVNTYTTGIQRVPEITMDAEGDFVVAWTDLGAVDGDGHAPVARRFLGRAPELTSHRDGDPVDCAEPWLNSPTFAWDPDGYDRFKVFLGSHVGFLKGTAVSSGDTWLKVPSWRPNRKKWKNICLKALAVNPGSPIMYLRVQGRDTDLAKRDPERTRFSGTVEAIPQP